MTYKQRITFVTAEDAPEQFDGWTFFWKSPEGSDTAKYEYVLLKPDGSEHYVYEMPPLPPESDIRSDFSERVAGGKPDAFFGQRIRFVLRVSEGAIRIEDSPDFHFSFYRNRPDGKVNFNRAFEHIDAVLEK